MCKGYPVIRCSAYAKDMLKEANARMETAVTFEEKESAERLKERAEDIYFTTPAGFKELEELIDGTEDGLDKDALFNRLVRGKKEREAKVIENNRLNRMNAENIRVAAELKETGLPWWAAGCQLATENILQVDPEADVKINSKTKTFVVTSGESKTLITGVKYHFTLYVEDEETYVWEGSLQRKVSSITDAFKSRGEGEHILEEELTFEQLRIVEEAVIEHFRKEGYSDMYATEPKIGVMKHVQLNENTDENTEEGLKFSDVYSVALHTPTTVRNGTDKLNPTSFQRLKDTLENVGTVVGVEMIDGRVIVETSGSISVKNFIVGDEFLLKPVKENFYEARSLGRVKGKQYRVSLMLK